MKKRHKLYQITRSATPNGFFSDGLFRIFKGFKRAKSSVDGPLKNFLQHNPLGAEKIGRRK